MGARFWRCGWSWSRIGILVIYRRSVSAHASGAIASIIWGHHAIQREAMSATNCVPTALGAVLMRSEGISIDFHRRWLASLKLSSPTNPCKPPATTSFKAATDDGQGAAEEGGGPAPAEEKRAQPRDDACSNRRAAALIIDGSRSGGTGIRRAKSFLLRECGFEPPPPAPPRSAFSRMLPTLRFAAKVGRRLAASAVQPTFTGAQP